MNKMRWFTGIIIGAVFGWVIAQYYWIRSTLQKTHPQAVLAARPHRRKKTFHFPATRDHHNICISHTVQNGIERIVYTPKNQRFNTPILFVHGMWHAASGWNLWQELLAEWGWESISFSLPGHAGSPTRRPISLCTMDYYLGFLKDELEQLGKRPVMVGHDMGGALVQWYLKFVGDLPAVVMAASWGSHSVLRDSLFRLVQLDPIGCLLSSTSWNAAPLVRSHSVSSKKLITEGAAYSGESLQSMLGPESALVLFQHAPPFWSPPHGIQTPMLWLAGEEDALMDVEAARRAASHYRADFVMVKNMGHDLMLERLFSPTVEMIHSWVLQHGID